MDDLPRRSEENKAENDDQSNGHIQGVKRDFEFGVNF